MRIVPNQTIELEYDTTMYSFRVVSIEHATSGFDIVFDVTDEFKKKFKRRENLARWSHRRFEKFLVGSLEKFLDESR
jgi:hypothetical protein